MLGIQHVAIGASDKRRLTRLSVDLLGLTVLGGYTSVAENVDEDILAMGAGPRACEIDLMQPPDPDATSRPPARHSTTSVSGSTISLRLTAGSAAAGGVRFAAGGIRKGAAGHNVCFIHPKGDESRRLGGEGVLIELVQAPREIVEAMQPEAPEA